MFQLQTNHTPTPFYISFLNFLLDFWNYHTKMEMWGSLPHFHIQICQFYLPDLSLPSISFATAAVQACTISYLDYFKNLFSGLLASKLPSIARFKAGRDIWKSTVLPALNLAMAPYCLQMKLRLLIPASIWPQSLLFFPTPFPLVFSPCILLIWGSSGLNNCSTKLNKCLGFWFLSNTE